MSDFVGFHRNDRGQRTEDRRRRASGERERTSHHLDKVGIMRKDEDEVKGERTERHEERGESSP